MKKLLLILVGLLTVVTAWASSATEGADNSRDIGHNYTFDSETGELLLLYGEFSKDYKWGSEVDPSSVKSVTATGNVTFIDDCSELFKGFNNCTSMDLFGVFTGEATNMSKMFQGCTRLTTLEISNWNVHNVTDMSWMFANCTCLPSLDLSDWLTENVTDMNNMFMGCSMLTSLDLSGWSNDNVTNMMSMFSQCINLSSLNLSGFRTPNVTNMTNMFSACSQLTSLDLSGWDTSNVIIMTSMFISCTNLQSINIAGWEISNNIVSLGAMFAGCSHLTTIYASTSWNAENVPANSAPNMFNSCTSLVGGMGTTFNSNYTDKTYARIDRGTEQPGYFTGVFTLSLPDKVTASPNPVCSIDGARYYAAGSTVTLTYDGEVPQGKILIYKVNGTQIEGNTFQMPLDDVTVTYEINALPCNYTYDSETGALTLISGEFSKNKKWGSDVVANAVTSVTATNQVGFAGDCTELFKGFTNCTSMDLGSVSTSEVTNMSEMFRECQSLTSIDLSGWNTSKVTNMLYLFYKCTNLKSINLTGWDLGQTTNMISTFRECDSLNTIYVSTSWDVGNVNISLSMFAYCYELVGGCGTTFSADHTDVEYARIDRGTEEPGYLTGVFTLSLPNNVTASPKPVCTLSGADYYATGETVTLNYRGTVPEGKMVVYSVNGMPIDGNTFQMPLDDVTVTVTFRYLPIEVAVGDLTFNMIKVDGNDEISTFYIAECEVTEALWLAVMGGDNPSSFQGNLEDNRPVENISWNDCQEFIAKLKQMTRLDFRLPTSAEWLFAASGGNDTHGYTYSGSNTIDDVAWYASNCEQKQTVGTKAPNELGIYDMSGNVYEIIQEATGAYGGGWHSPAKNCKVNYYWPANEDYTDNDTGFRLAITNFNEIPETVTVGGITFNMIKVNGNDDISTFYIGECEVTEALWQEVMGNNPSSLQGDLADNLPVENVSWNDCQEFIAKLKQMTRLNFRLPTSAEWLFAAGGGNNNHGHAYSGSSNIDDVAWYNGNCSQKQTVGTKAPNELGIHDMSGNVYEIIQEATRVWGGGWHSSANNCMIISYWSANEAFSDNDTGFRLALTNFDEIQTVIGDVNGDGDVTAADVTCIYNYLLNGDETFIDTCDVDGDGFITSVDITVIYNIMLGSK